MQRHTHSSNFYLNFNNILFFESFMACFDSIHSHNFPHIYSHLYSHLIYVPYCFHFKPIIPSCVALIILAMPAIWNCWHTRSHISNENQFSSSRCFQIPIAGQLWVGLLALIPSTLPCWSFALIWFLPGRGKSFCRTL